MLLLTQYTQKKLKIVYDEKFEANVIEVKNIEGIGTTIDVILVNGIIHKNDKIVLCGMTGPIVTTIKNLLIPHG